MTSQNPNHYIVAVKPPKQKPRHKKQWRRKNPASFSQDSAARQFARHEDLVTQFHEISDRLVGRSVFLALPGFGCRHDPSFFRPVAIQPPRYRSRPDYPVLTVEEDRLLFTVASSSANHATAKMDYAIKLGWDFAQNPAQPDGVGKIPALLAVGNNMLQELINTVDRPVQQLSLPALVFITSTVRVDATKLEAVAASVSAELREMYIAQRKKSAAITSHGELFADAELAPDEDIQQAFVEGRAYEDFSALLGAEVSNPIRKILHAANPAYEVLKAANMPLNWAEQADTAVIDQLIDMMRSRLPLPELATATDLLDGLAEPDQPIKFSLKIEQLPIQPLLRAMRATFPPSSTLLKVVTDAELIAAARNPAGPLVVKAYARPQIVETAALRNLPAYASGELVPASASRRTVELA